MKEQVIVGTRKSPLAVTQTNWVVERLKEKRVPCMFHLEELSTEGDRKLHISLTEFERSGMFINDLEELLALGEIDVAVHSLKDIPLETDDRYVIAAIPEREDYRDAYIGKENVTLDELPNGAVIGTSSPRRKAQLAAKYPHLVTKWIRGPIDSRIEQLHAGNYDGIILAIAGLKRLGKTEHITTYLDPDHFTPAPGQGALAVQCRRDDEQIVKMLRAIHDEATFKAVRSERYVLKLLDEEDKAPIGAYATVNEDITLFASVYSLDGKVTLTTRKRAKDPLKVAKLAADDLLEQGARSIIVEAKKELQNE